MNFGVVCKDNKAQNCLSRWNGSSFHIAVSHRTNANEMNAWMPVVQALTHHPIIDWFGLQGQMNMQRTCFTKLILGQSAALHLYNDHRLPAFPFSYPSPEFDVSGLSFVSIFLRLTGIAFTCPFLQQISFAASLSNSKILNCIFRLQFPSPLRILQLG